MQVLSNGCQHAYQSTIRIARQTQSLLRDDRKGTRTYRLEIYEERATNVTFVLGHKCLDARMIEFGSSRSNKPNVMRHEEIVSKLQNGLLEVLLIYNNRFVRVSEVCTHGCAALPAR